MLRTREMAFAGFKFQKFPYGLGFCWIRACRRYVDDTLVLIKPSDIPAVLKKFNSFDKNLQLIPFRIM